MCNAIYIIAYHGSRDNVETRKKRSDNHNAQIDWWLNYDKQIEIRVLAMDFDESEFWDNSRVRYIDRLDVPFLVQVQEISYLITSMTIPR